MMRLDNHGRAEVTHHRNVITVKGIEGFVQGNFRAADRAEEAVGDRKETPVCVSVGFPMSLWRLLDHLELKSPTSIIANWVA